MTIKHVLFIGGPDDGKLLPIDKQPVHHGAILTTFLDRPMSMRTAAAVANGDMSMATTHAAFDRFDYRVVLFRCDDVDRYVAIDNALPDHIALEQLIMGYRHR